MPVMEGYIYADTPHQKTVRTGLWHYRCFTLDPTERRGRETVIRVQVGWTSDGRAIFEQHKTTWLRHVGCGHITALRDAQCAGCALRG